MTILKPQPGPGGVPEVGPEDLQPHVGKVRLIDVRRPDEYAGELGHIPGAELVELGPDLMRWLETAGDRSQEIVFICRSGGRSCQATAASRQMGFKNTINLRGGMMQWNARGFVTEK